MVASSRRDCLQEIRAREVAAALGLAGLEPPARILDFGAGDGFVADLMRARGFDVSAVDVAPRRPLVFPVVRVGPTALPFRSDTFDAVVSSNVLEHVRDLPGTLAELRRVLTARGLGVFWMPTPAWRVVTLLETPLRVALGRWLGPLFEGGDPPPPPTGGDLGRGPRARSLARRAVRLLARPHGEFPTSFHEIRGFSQGSWIDRLEAGGFSVVGTGPGPLAYGSLLRFPALALRSALAGPATSGTRIYCVRPRGPVR